MFEGLARYILLGLHIPDNFLTLPVSALFWILTVVALAFAVRRTNQALDDRQIPLMGVMAACIFAGQMLNFPVAGGTSGHLLGGALAAIVLGPAAGMLVMACVLALQALLFQDGGLVVMGANIFDMGILTALIGWAVFAAVRAVVGPRTWGVAIAGFVAAWISVVAAALMASLQLIASGSAQPSVVIPTMSSVHMVIGIGEGLITAAALGFLQASRPDLAPALATENGAARRPLATRAVLGVGLLIALLLTLLSPFASSSPDGLEWVAAQLGFLQAERGPSVASPAGVLPDYTVRGVEGGLSTILAGIVGVLIVAALGYGLALLIRRRRAPVVQPEHSTVA